MVHLGVDICCTATGAKVEGIFRIRNFYFGRSWKRQGTLYLI